MKTIFSTLQVSNIFEGILEDLIIEELGNIHPEYSYEELEDAYKNNENRNDAIDHLINKLENMKG